MDADGLHLQVMKCELVNQGKTISYCLSCWVVDRRSIIFFADIFLHLKKISSEWSWISDPFATEYWACQIKSVNPWCFQRVGINICPCTYIWIVNKYISKGTQYVLVKDILKNLRENLHLFFLSFQLYETTCFLCLVNHG